MRPCYRLARHQPRQFPAPLCHKHYEHRVIHSDNLMRRVCSGDGTGNGWHPDPRWPSCTPHGQVPFWSAPCFPCRFHSWHHRSCRSTRSRSRLRLGRVIKTRPPSQTQIHGRDSVRHHQGSDGISAISPSWAKCGTGRMGSGVYGVEPEKNACPGRLIAWFGTVLPRQSTLIPCGMCFVTQKTEPEPDRLLV